MGARTRARRHALDILFQAEVREVDAPTVLAEYRDRRTAADQQDYNPYVVEIVEGTNANRARIDEVISTASIGWDLDRMPGVDRNALRIGVWEILWRSDVPDQVAISEAVEAVKELSTDDSPAFVNGVLAAVASRDHAGADFEVAEESGETQPEDTDT